MALNDPILTVRRLDKLIEAARPHDLNVAEQAGLFAAVRFLCDDLDQHIRSEMGGDGYALEQVGKIRWHVGAALGFDTDNSHDDSAHRVWALGNASSRPPNVKDHTAFLDWYGPLWTGVGLPSAPPFLDNPRNSGFAGENCDTTLLHTVYSGPSSARVRLVGQRRPPLTPWAAQGIGQGLTA